MLRSKRVSVLAVSTLMATLAFAEPASAWDPTGSEPALPYAASAAWDPTGSEPTLPYAQPADASVPKRGCATTVSSPTAPPSTSPASFQIIYAWHDGEGNRYESSVERIAKVVDRIDWLLDQNTNYDQHLRFSCRSGYDTSTYGGYARALVVPEKIEAGNLSGETGWGTISNDLSAAGYDDPNRWYFVFEDFAGTSEAAYWCKTAGGGGCVGVAEIWDSGVAGHELIHMLGAPHAWSKEDGGQYGADIMMDFYNYWTMDQDFNTYYDPSELGAKFYLDPYPSTETYNIANHPALTAPACCDVGFNNDLLTAQERTVEADAPYATPSGFAVAGAGSMQVTPPGSDGGVSARYYDGRRSLTMTVQPQGASRVSVTRRPGVTAGARYKFFARLATATSGQVRLRMSWHNSTGGLISHSESALLTIGWDFYEQSFSAVAPTGATSVQVGVVAPSGQSFNYLLDSLQLNRCNNGQPGDGCRPSV